MAVHEKGYIKFQICREECRSGDEFLDYFLEQ